MTEQNKVTVDDIIGIVKTEEQTNSVEEVRKLRGRENKTAKRFKRYLFDGGFSFGEEYVPPKWGISDENTKGSPFGFLEFDDEHKDLCDEIVDSLNEFVDEYNHLKEENEHIKQTIKDMMENERTELGKMVLRQLWRQIQ